MTSFFDSIPLELFSRKISPTSKKLYTLLETANKFTKTAKVVVEDFTLECSSSLSRTSNRYFPEEIRKSIKVITTKRVVLSFNSREIEIKFMVCGNILFDVHKYVPYLKLWFSLMTLILPYKDVNQKLTIDIYLTDFKKLMPKNGDGYTSKHVNSAFTYVCREYGEITIYRKEEWFKVLLHECIHSYCLDFSTENDERLRHCLYQYFPFHITNAKFSETYTETWAEIMNCAIISFIDSGEGYRNFSLFFNFYIQVERVHSVIQFNKILRSYGLSYENLREKKSNWNQETHVFEYHILKTALLYSYDKFIDWCYMYNGKTLISFNKKALVEFCKLIMKCYDNSDFKRIVRRLKKKDNGISMRMSISEI